MSHKTTFAHQRERGQTIVLVALSIVTLLAMAALAIDVVTLYVARTEMQRAADATALAAAKAFVDSGFTSGPADASLNTLAQTMANAAITATVLQNKIAGVAPALSGTPTFNFTQQGNPQISVTLQRNNLPIFFARIWGSRLATVTATATAEAYNPSTSQTITGSYIPIAPKCVKPLLIPNNDPTHAGNPKFVMADGSVNPAYAGPAPGGFIGEAITLNRPTTGGGGCTPPSAASPAGAGDYFPAQASTTTLLPSCATGGSAFVEALEGCDNTTAYACGGTVNNATISCGGYRNFRTRNALRCAINDPSEDTLSLGTFPNGPMQITAQSGPLDGKIVTTSNSVMTIPVYDPASTTGAGSTAGVTVVAFLQIFVDSATTPPTGTITAHVLNVVGCGNTPSATATPVSGGGISPIPVRLISP